MSEPLIIDPNRSHEFGGWTFTATQNGDTSGCVLERIRHDDYSFAKKVQVYRIWLKTKRDKKEKPYVLGSVDFPAQDGIKITSPAGSNADILIKPFIQAGLLTVQYKSRKGLFEDDPEQSLAITQTYIFTPYGREPAHEPSGTLEAARFYPMLEFKFSHPRKLAGPLYFRADYQLQISIGRGLGQSVVPTPTSAARAESSRPEVLEDPPRKDKATGGTSWTDGVNQAGIFADESWPLPIIESIFFLAEKPMKKEVVGYGFIDGFSKREKAAPPNQLCWDNIHQWGATATALPTTPGAAHASHCHWRWTPAAAIGSVF